MVAVLSAFAGQKYTLDVAADPEAVAFSRDIHHVLENSKWSWIVGQGAAFGISGILNLPHFFGVKYVTRSGIADFPARRALGEVFKKYVSNVDGLTLPSEEFEEGFIYPWVGLKVH